MCSTAEWRGQRKEINELQDRTIELSMNNREKID